jgi:MarR family transcriptional regulator for hemolysin
MLQFDFDQSVGSWIHSAAHALSCALNDELEKLGITRRQWEVLAWISYEGELSQSRLAELMGIEAPTLVGVLDRMERDGWIHRVPSETDRRKKMIHATQRVEPVWAKMVACCLKVRSQATRGLTEQQLIQLRDILSVIRKNIRSKPERESQVSENATSDVTA